MKKQLLTLCMLTAIAVSSCKKSSSGPEPVPVPTDESNIPFNIELTSDWSTSTLNEAIINSDDKEEITFSAKVTNKKGEILNKDFALTKDGVQFIGKKFKTITPGKYVFQAAIGELKSNVYKVTARDFAERYAEVESSRIVSINSAGLVTVSIKGKNISNKRLKYITYKVSCYNKVNDLIREEINKSSYITCRATGLFEPNQSLTADFIIGYFSGTTTIKSGLYSITFEDGTTEFAL